MKKIRILLVENTPSMAAMLVRKLELDRRFDVSERADAVAALQLIERQEFDVVFVDLHLAERDTGEPIFDGISVGEAARKRLPHAVIVMYSQQISSDNVLAFPHFIECQRAGADKVLARAPLFSLIQADLSALIDQLISERREAESAKSHVQFDSGLLTRAAVDLFDVTELRRLLVKSVAGQTHLKVQAIQSGFSGAALFRVKAAQHENFTSASQLVIKVSTSQFALEDELQRKPVPGSLFASSSVLPHTHIVTEHDGLFSVSIAEVRKKHLLRDYLNEGKITRSSEKVLSRVVDDLLVGPACESRPAEELNLSEDAYRLRPSAINTIDEFLREASTWSSILKAADLVALDTTRKLLRRALEGHWNFTVAGRHVAQLHGDFHCRNVFVSTDDAPVLIDFGRSDVYPRFFDFAALDTDLIVSLWGHGSGSDQDFSEVNGWFRSVTRSFPFDRSTIVEPKNRIEFLRNAILSQVQQVTGVSPSEYAETLMFQYLRYLRFPSVAVPKKILAARLISELCRVLNLS